MIILGAALGFTNYLVDAFIPLKILNYMEECPVDERPHLVLLTALSSRTREEAVSAIGFQGRLTKPVKPRQLDGVLTGRNLVHNVGKPSVSQSGNIPVEQAAPLQPGEEFPGLVTENAVLVLGAGNALFNGTL